VTGPAAFAFGNARVRARKSRLLGPEDGLVLRAACAAGAPAAAATALPRLETDVRALFAALVDDYDVLLRGYRARGADLILGLLGLHEVENLKLVWRARARGQPLGAWSRFWRPLGRLATLHADAWRVPLTDGEALARLSGTPYAQIAASVARAHHADPGAAEMAFDRWASARVWQAAAALPRAEHAARTLVRSLALERDLGALHRAVASNGLSPRQAAAAPVLLGQEMDAAALEALAGWVPETGSLGSLLPPGLLRGAPVRDWDELSLQLRRRRRQACLRAFRAPPFQMAPAVAYLLLREAELQSLRAFAEARGWPPAPPLLDRALAASAMGA
jgi:vacuolar-type H+-ATPase subunit C/Vma6